MATESLKSSVSSTQPIQRRFTLWHLSLILVLIGIGISGYLSYVKLTDVPMVCAGGGVFSCETVQNSAYSRLFGIPIAWLGLGVYLLLAALLFLEPRVAFLQVYGRIIIFGIALFAWIYSMFLVHIQFNVLQALCMWCLAHELNFTIFFAVTCLRLRNNFAQADETIVY
jgi:uncharacterized membrane protein